DAQGIAISSYQGGHMEFFKYMYDLLRERGAGHIRIFGGGGGVIVPREIRELEEYGVDKIFSPDDGRELGLQGMINHMLSLTDFDTSTIAELPSSEELLAMKRSALARAVTLAEHGRLGELNLGYVEKVAPVLGITGTGGAGKSSLTDELVRRFLLDHPERTMAIISIDPSRRRSGGALLGDRIRMNAVSSGRIYMRSLATRGAKGEVTESLGDVLSVVQHAGFDLVVIETSGIGQGDTDIVDYADASLYVMTSEFGAWSQLEKIDMLDYADLVAINKFEKGGSEDALRAVRKQVRRNRNISYDVPDEQLPVFGTIASQFNDLGVNALYVALMEEVGIPMKEGTKWRVEGPISSQRSTIIPAERTRYLAEIAETCRDYRKEAEAQADIASSLYRVTGAIEALGGVEGAPAELLSKRGELEQALTPGAKKLVDGWDALVESYDQEIYEVKIRTRTLEIPLKRTSFSGTTFHKVALPRYRDWGDVLRWQMIENVPGRFPFTAGVFPFKREDEDPKRMFAGEGTPARTNKRFHYLSEGEPAKRLSTAFDSV
ncbi:MAG: GTP-binding protein, partial [Myxococcota bacterium]